MVYSKHCNFESDIFFKTLETEGLKYYPWIGTEFNSSDNKTLIVGESVYNWEKEEDKRKDAFNALDKFDFSRVVAYDHGIDNIIPQRYFARNIEKLIKGRKLSDKNEHINFWENIAFHELVQRPMKTIDERPTKADYELGAKLLNKIIEKLEIETCIFLGTDWNKFASVEKEMINSESLHFPEKINNTHPKVIKLNNNYSSKIYFVKHPSKFFSSDKWNKFILEN
jgi:hypothetical protein